MNDNFRFRESFRGYNRDDVNAYIEQMNVMFSRKEADLRAYISQIEGQAAVAAPSAHSEADWANLNQELAHAKQEIERLQAELTAEKNKPVTCSETEEKSKLYDSMSAQVGNILIVANSNAEKILEEANADGDKIRAEARMDAEKTRLEAECRMETMIAELDARLQGVSQACITEYAKLLTDAQLRFGSLTESMKKRSEELLLNIVTKSQELESMITDEYGTTDKAIEV